MPFFYSDNKTNEEKWRKLDRWLGFSSEIETSEADRRFDEHQARLELSRKLWMERAAEAERLADERDEQWEQEMEKSGEHEAGTQPPLDLFRCVAPPTDEFHIEPLGPDNKPYTRRLTPNSYANWLSFKALVSKDKNV